MDKNGYVGSILPTEDGHDFVLEKLWGRYYGRLETVRHEIFFGTANRRVSKENGFWINVCPDIHRTIHEDPALNMELRRICQWKYEETHSREDFVRLIGRSYL